MQKTDFVAAILLSSFLCGCASTAPPTIFVPSETASVVSYFRNGIPIASFSEDSSLVVLSLEESDLGNTKYMRLWFLYKNNSMTPYLLEPLKIVTLSLKGTKRSYDDIGPESPTNVLARIDNEKAISLIAQAIGGALSAASTRPTTLTISSGEEMVVNDQAEKKEAKMLQTSSSMTTTSLLYDEFKHSVNAGILRRNTIFPGESVNGYVYFPLPLRETGFDRLPITPSKYNYNLKITTQFGSNVIEFVPGEGE
jgi:hypothetical protein